jgi:hypothetical protein
MSTKQQPKSVEEYKEMGYEALHKEVAGMISLAQRLVTWRGRAEHFGLLPALTALQQLTAQPGRRIPIPGVPSWREECELLGITAEVVRQWRSRTQSEKDMRMMLGEQVFKRPKHNPLDAKLTEQQLYKLVTSILNDEEIDPESQYYRIALAIAEDHEW